MNRLVVPDEWRSAINEFCARLVAGGAPRSTVTARRQQIEHAARRLGGTPGAVTAASLIDYMSAQDWARETRRGRRAAFVAFFKWAKREGVVSGNPAKRLPRVKAVQASPRPVPREVYEAARRRADARMRMILALAHDAGLRRGEIALVHANDVFQDFVGWSLLVHGKGGKERVVPLTPRLAFELRAWIAGQGGGWAFPGDIDGHLSPRRVSELGVEVLDPPWTLHTLRHRFATDLLASGADLLEIRDALGHASVATTQIYTAVATDAVREAIYRARGAHMPGPVALTS